MTEIGRNEPCPCGGGQKFKKCCFGKTSGSDNSGRAYAQKRREKREKLAAIPRSPEGAQTHDASKEELMELCLVEIERILQEARAESVTKLVDQALAELRLCPTFSYLEIADTLEADERFAVVRSELCGLAGTNPVKLYVNRLGF